MKEKTEEETGQKTEEKTEQKKVIKYHDLLWNKVNDLSEKTYEEFIQINLLSNICKKFSQGLLDISKILEEEGINKEIDKIQENNNTLTQAVFFYRKKTKEISEATQKSSDEINNLLDPLFKYLIEESKKQRDTVNQYIKLTNTCNAQKQHLYKSKIDYDNAVKVVEENLFKSRELSFQENPNPKIVQKITKNIKNGIKNAKSLQTNYEKSIVAMENLRKQEIEKQDNILKIYENWNKYIYKQTKILMEKFLEKMKNIFQKFLTSFVECEERMKKINVEKDITSFIEKNKSTEKPDPPVQFIPYYPMADLKMENISGINEEELVKLDIKYDILVELKNNFRDIRNDLNMNDELKKKMLDCYVEEYLILTQKMNLLQKKKVS
jgi:hypothetical protein